MSELSTLTRFFSMLISIFFFYKVFLSQTLTIHGTAEEETTPSLLSTKGTVV